MYVDVLKDVHIKDNVVRLHTYIMRIVNVSFTVSNFSVDLNIMCDVQYNASLGSLEGLAN